MKSKIILPRRDAIKLGVAATTIGLSGLNPATLLAEEKKEAPRPQLLNPGQVVKVHMPGMRGKRFPHARAARQMVDKAVTTLAQEGDLGRAWSKFIQKEDRVGIKINCLGGRMVSTMVEVVDAIVEGVRAVGVSDANIMIFDQFGGNMRGARYKWQEKKGRLRVLNHQVLGFDRAWTRAEHGRGKFSKAFLWATAIINVPVIKDHDLAGAGITCSMKNMVFGCVERPAMMHRGIENNLPHFYALDQFRSRVRLIITDGSFCLYDGGPKNNPGALVTHDCVYAATDPVSMDRIALEVVETIRKEKGLRSLEAVRRPATFIRVAEQLGLGVGTREKISLDTIELPPFNSAQV